MACDAPLVGEVAMAELSEGAGTCSHGRSAALRGAVQQGIQQGKQQGIQHGFQGAAQGQSSDSRGGTPSVHGAVVGKCEGVEVAARDAKSARVLERLHAPRRRLRALREPLERVRWR